MNTLPKLTGNEDYINWSDQTLLAFKYCGIDKILMGDWTKPAVSTGDATSEQNAQEWESLDRWISLHLSLSNVVRGQVWHLKTSYEKWAELEKKFKPASMTSITLHLTSIVNVHYDESTKFEDFVASKCEHNRLLGELSGTTLPDSYIAIFIRSSLPDNLKQYVAHIPDDMITADQLINIIHSRKQESIMQTMQASSSDTALFGHRNKGRKKQDFKPCENPNCNNWTSHPTLKCWSPGGPKHNPDRAQKLNRKKKEKVHKADGDEDDEDEGSTTSLRIHLDRSFVATQSDSDLLYFSPTDSSTSLTTSQAYIAKGPSRIIIDSGTTSHIHNVRSDFEFIDKDDTNTITDFTGGRGGVTQQTN